jgi:hypothetical protein
MREEALAAGCVSAVAPGDPVRADTRCQQREPTRGPRAVALRRALPKCPARAPRHCRICSRSAAGNGALREVDALLTSN